MEPNVAMSREELERQIEEAKRKVQEMLDRMTPEERAQAQAKAQNLIAEDQAAMQKLIENATAVLNSTAPAAQTSPRFCRNCGAPAEGGKFCSYCGSAL